MNPDLERQLADLRPGAHACLIYEIDAEQAAVIAPFVKHGLSRGERCLYVADVLSVDQVLDLLATSGVDVRAATARGALHVLSRRDAHHRTGEFSRAAMIDYLIDSAQQAVAAGFSGLRFSAEMTWSLGPERGNEDLIPFEGQVTEHVAMQGITGLCQYDRRKFDLSVIREVLRTHLIVVLHDHVCPNLYYEPPELVFGGDGAHGARVDWMLQQLRAAKEKDLALQLLADAGSTLTSSLDFETTLENVARLAIPLLADGCAVDILMPDGMTRRLASDQHDRLAVDPRSWIDRRYAPDPDAAHPISRVLATGQLQVMTTVTDADFVAAAQDEAHLQGLRALGLTSAMFAPLIARGRTIGVLSLAARRPGRRFGPEEVQLAKEIADRAALAVDNAQLFQQEQRRRRQLEAVRTVAAAMTRELDLTPLLTFIVKEAALLVGDAAAMVYLLDESGKTLSPHAGHGLPRSGAEPMGTRPLQLGEGITGTVARTRRGVFENDYRSSAYATRGVRERSRVAAALSAPIAFQDRLVGVITLWRVEGEPQFAQEDLELIGLFADAAAIAIENARLYQERARQERRLHDLVGRLLVSQEEERRRVAYDVHDGLAQSAASANRHLQAFAQFYRPRSSRAREELARTLELAQQTVSEARRLIAGLRPAALDDLGLEAALRLEVDALAGEGWDVTYKASLGPKRLPPDLETALFRICQEALANVRKHTAPGPVHVTLSRRDDRVRLTVRDWGSGFDPATPVDGARASEHVGLASIQERVALLGGRWTLRSRRRAGTSIVVEVPLVGTSPNGGRNGRTGGAAASHPAGAPGTLAAPSTPADRGRP